MSEIDRLVEAAEKPDWVAHDLPDYDAIVRAILSAMREPEDWSAMPYGSEGREVWQAMIDHLLAET